MKPLPYRWNPLEHPEMASMTREQRDCYRTLIDYCWTLEGLPKDILELAAITSFSPAKDFEKAVWNKIKDNFFASGGKYQYPGFEKQFKGLERLQRRASKAAEKRWENERKRKAKAMLKHESKISNSPVAECISISQEEVKQCTEPEPGPVAQPTEQASNAQAMPEQETSIAEEATEKIVARETGPHFDEYAAWLEFAELYPEKNLIKNKLAMDTFIAAIKRRLDYEKLLRSLSNYQAQIGKPGFREPELFLDWFKVWWEWEDWAIMPQNQTK